MENSEHSPDPVLYILMRTDMASMTPGMAAAQASHASLAFVNEYYRDNTKGPAGIAAFKKWSNSTDGGFGTTVVLAANGNTIDLMMAEYSVVPLRLRGYVADVIIDPTYPVRDGDITHRVSVMTCAYVFVPDRRFHDPAFPYPGLPLY